MTRTLIRDIAGQPGVTVTLEGWLHKKRLLGGLNFITLRDRTGLAQSLIDNNSWSPRSSPSTGHRYQDSSSRDDSDSSCWRWSDTEWGNQSPHPYYPSWQKYTFYTSREWDFWPHYLTSQFHDIARYKNECHSTRGWYSTPGYPSNPIWL